LRKDFTTPLDCHIKLPPKKKYENLIIVFQYMCPNGIKAKKIMCVSTLRACPQFLNQIVGQNSENGFPCPIYILGYGHQPTWQWIGVSEGSLLPFCNPPCGGWMKEQKVGRKLVQPMASSKVFTMCQSSII
jgi:hypothetical protein